MDTNKKKVLVIDDDDNLRNILVDTLAVSGFTAEGAHNGDEGLKKAFETHPDAILLDILMPGMDGWEVLKRLRLDAWGLKAKVGMLTSQGQAENVMHALDKKVFTYIVKSDLNMNNIGSVVNNLIKSPVV